MTKRSENHTLWGRTYLYSPYKGVPLPPSPGYWPSSFFACLCVPRSINTWKKNETNIQPSWPNKLVKKWFISWDETQKMIFDLAGLSEKSRAELHLTLSGCQSQRGILPAHGASPNNNNNHILLFPSLLWTTLLRKRQNFPPPFLFVRIILPRVYKLAPGFMNRTKWRKEVFFEALPSTAEEVAIYD